MSVHSPSPKTECLAVEPAPPHPPPSTSSSGITDSTQGYTGVTDAHCLRPRDELLAKVQQAQSIELALWYIMEASPLSQTLESPKRRRVTSQNGSPSVCHSIPPDNRLDAPLFRKPSRYSAVVQQVRAAATE